MNNNDFIKLYLPCIKCKSEKQLIKEKNTLRWQQDNLISEKSQSEQKRLRKAIDGQRGSIKILRTEIKKLQRENRNFQNKYHNLYIILNII